MYESGYAGGGFGGMILFVWAVLYFYFAFTQYKIAQKVGHQSPWWSWIPVLNLFQQIQMAGKEWWWFILYLVPVVNIFAMAYIWVCIAKNCHKPAFWGILSILPFLNFIAWGYLAFSGGDTPPQPTPTPTPHQHEPVG